MEGDAETVDGGSATSERLNEVLGRIDGEEAIRFLRDLIRIPSVYRPGDPEGNETRAARHVAGYLEEIGFDVSTEEAAPGRPNVWAVW
ncbi:MAG: hypothetical protein H0V83_08630, partial [Rubrobacter sp.]|nr:hypothetical protein [Rubrobacter sp.]